MPYAVRKRGSKWVTVNKNTGDVKGTHSSKAKAEAQRRLLEGIKHGWKPTGKKSSSHKKTGKRKKHGYF